jgi:arginase family enzyme
LKDIEVIMDKKTIGIVGSQMDMGAVRKGVDMGPLAISAQLLSITEESKCCG